MPDTFGDLKAKVAQDLRRSNLGPEISDAVIDAINDHDGERFWFNDTAQPYTLTVSPGGGVAYADDATPLGDLYPLPPQGPVQEFIRIDRIRASIGVWYTVKGSDWITLENLYSTRSNGQPAWWAFQQGLLRIYPLPAGQDGYPIRIYGHFRCTPLVNDTDTNPWTRNPAAFNLIRYTALKRLYSYPIRDAEQVGNADQAGQAALAYLRRETERRVRSGRMRAYYG